MSGIEILILGATLVVAIAAVLLATFIIDLATVSLVRYRDHFTDQAQFQAREFFLFVDGRKMFVANLALMGLGAVAVWVTTGNPFLAVPAFIALGFLPHLVYRRMRQHRLRQFEAQLPDALMTLSGALRAGSGMLSALNQVVAEAPPPLAQEFALMLREQRLGMSQAQSLENLAQRVPTPTTILMVSAMRIASETGGGLAETLESTARTIRARLQMEGKIRALTSQGKLQAWVVGALPLGLMLVLEQMDPDAMALLFHTRPGWAALVVVALLELTGIYLIRKIVRIDV